MRLNEFVVAGAESAHQKGATDQVEAMARDLEYTRAELASAKQNLDKAHSDQSKVRFFGEQLHRLCLYHMRGRKQRSGSCRQASVLQARQPCLQCCQNE